jgi:hypothetical protein
VIAVTRHSIVCASHQPILGAGAGVASISLGNCLTNHDILSIVNTVTWVVGTGDLEIALASASVAIIRSGFSNLQNFPCVVASALF